MICLRHVEAKFSSAHAQDRDDLDDVSTTRLLPSDTIDQAYVCCMTCRHGGEFFDSFGTAGRWADVIGHANHVIAWFNGGLDGEGGHDTCPVAGCACECANI